jgi:hypothetical protein
VVAAAIRLTTTYIFSDVYVELITYDRKTAASYLPWSKRLLVQIVRSSRPRGWMRRLGYAAFPLLACGRKEPEHGCDQKQRGYIAGEVPEFVSVVDGLRGHDAGMDQARPYREGDQAAVAVRITRRGD